MVNNRVIKILFLCAVFFSALYFVSCSSKNKDEEEAVAAAPENPNSDPNIIPQFVNINYIELNKIGRISKFRSGIGHDYSDDFEHCRSMKHYFLPLDNADWSSVKIISPVNGTVDNIFDEWAGTQIQIKSDLYPNILIIIFHVNQLSPLKAGDKVAEGQQLGTHIGSQTYSDIAVVQITSSGRKMISYFDIMTESLFQNYILRGLNSRNDFIISSEARNGDPLNCNGETFAATGTIENWVILR